MFYAAVADVSLWADLRESEARSFRSGPWAAVRGARLDPMQPVPGSWDLNPQVSKVETLEEPYSNFTIAQLRAGLSSSSKHSG